MMGIRFIAGEDGAAPAAPPEPKAAEVPKPAEPARVKTDWEIEAQKWEGRAKENYAAVAKLAEIEEEKKTDEQKVTDRIAAAEKRAADLETQVIRAEVAAAKGIPASLLHSGTKEELEAEADALIEFKGIQPEPEAKPDKKSYFVPDEGGIPALGKQDNISPGMGSLRAGYAQE
jgi:hypothetical protein